MAPRRIGTLTAGCVDHDAQIVHALTLVRGKSPRATMLERATDAVLALPPGVLEDAARRRWHIVQPR